MILDLDKMKRGVIMECCNCHRQIESNYEYCPFCGTKQAVPAPGEPHFKNPSQLVQVNSEFVAIGPYELKEESESGDYTITLVRVNLNDIEDLYFPDHVRKIGPDSFAGAKNLKTIVIPQGVIEIGAGAFKDCPNLTNVVIAPSVTVIGEDAFANCPSLHRLTIPPNATISWKGMNDIETIDIASSTIYMNASTNLVLTRDGAKLVHVHRTCGPWQEHLGRPGRLCIVSKLEIPKSVLVIGAYAFDGCYEYSYLRDELYIRSLPEFVLPEGIRELEACAFYNSGFRAIVLPATLNKIGAHAFKDCIHLERIANIAHVDQVGEDICMGCNRLGDPETLAGIATRNQES